MPAMDLAKEKENVRYGEGLEREIEKICKASVCDPFQLCDPASNPSEDLAKG